ncbi:hypothetical protein pBo2 [Bovine gammaherpesvirus 4]|uniref:Uncharacterized protein ORF Bo2 n=2 Tax=Bovine herpesvirus 4 TaxID=10385 RepID=A0A0F6N4P8_BHV4|nr:hypothetical protein pBo2 [Bovine gammaherpesvirus 4]AAK07923.1 hypothetical protein pBo2 [Bovine gammaherpesvirus 4]AEL29748.1 hypothetical protein [Bovine gammaherpesvirus 4]AIA82752.1 hypothetical protein pBo2 [Bovine gammaherpesvirus 4]QJC19145.1 putative protein pBo2 [Bovine gammaherpesvirus 4]QJC19214.1 putative protein pBo2 [Bovine gammaherpesvirus 4]
MASPTQYCHRMVRYHGPRKSAKISYGYKDRDYTHQLTSKNSAYSGWSPQCPSCADLNKLFVSQCPIS